MAEKKERRTPKFKLTLYVESASIVSLQSRLAKAGVSEDEIAKVEKVNFNQSRADRFSEVKTALDDLVSDVDDLKQELEDWKENLPENLRDGEKASELESAIDALDEVSGSIGNASDECDNVEFPSMM